MGSDESIDNTLATHSADAWRLPDSPGTSIVWLQAIECRLRTQLNCLPTILTGTMPEGLEHSPSPGKWSARENLAHLTRYQEMFRERVERILAETRPALPRYRAEDDPDWEAWRGRSLTEILQALEADRAGLRDRLERLPEEAFARTGLHPRFGELSLKQWIEFFLLHEAHHLLAVLQRSRE